jgi:hypothetical protein
MRKKTAGAAVLTLVTGMVLGGTVFRAQVADAAAILQVRVVNTTADPVPVDQQGTTDVNVTNGSLDVAVAPPAPVTSGGQRLQVGGGVTSPLGLPVTASALVVQFRNDASEIIFFLDETIVARFPAPGPLVLALSQPLKFDAVRCGGSPATASCDFGWAGSAS